MSGVEITLSRSELRHAEDVGYQRNLAAIFARRANKYGDEGESWQPHVDGAIGELAVAIWRDKHWRGFVDDFQSLPGDVGDGLEVRTTRHANGRLLMKRADRPVDDRAFLLVTLDPPVVTLRGWMIGSDAMVPEFWTPPPAMRHPCYAVPQSRLRPVDELEAFLTARVAA